MNLVIIAAVIAVAGAAKLDRTYLPPVSAKSAGGSAESLQTPFAANSLNEASGGFPKGSFTNDFQGVVVDAALPGTRAAGEEETGLGAPRTSYGSTNSKVGDAAFRGSLAGFRQTPGNSEFIRTNQAADVQTAGTVATPQGFSQKPGDFGGSAQGIGSQSLAQAHQDGFAQGQFNSQGFSQGPRGSQGHGSFASAQAFVGTPTAETNYQRSQALSARDRDASILRFDSNVGTDSYSYSFETDNGISAEENGIATNGVHAQGGYSYTGDDGQVYSITYTADEGGYQPKGDHLPTPPPIPVEILKSLEQNAREEAAGLVDDGSYDAQKYNAEGDYNENGGANVEHNRKPPTKFGNRPESDATASGTFINQSNQPFVRPSANALPGQGEETNTGSSLQGSNAFGSPQNVNGFDKFQNNGAPTNTQGNNVFGTSSNSNFGQANDAPGNRFQQNSNQKGTPQQLGFGSFTNQKVEVDDIRTQGHDINPSSLPIEEPNSFNLQSTSNGRPSNSNSFGSQVTNQNNFGHREQSSQSGFGSKNEYLPPVDNFGQNRRPSSTTGQRPGSSTTSSQDTNNFSQSFSNLLPSSEQEMENKPQDFTSTPSSAIGTASNTQFGSHQNNKFSNGFKPNRFSSTQNVAPTSQNTGFGQFQNQKATAQPVTELTTPFETSPSSQQNSDKDSDALAGFESQSSQNRPTQTSFENESHSNGMSRFPKPTSASASAFAFPTASGQRPNSRPFDTNDAQSSSLFGQISQSQEFNQGNGFRHPQSQKEVAQNQATDVQFASSTQRPTFSQNSQQAQGPDDSYYYNQPSKPFNTPGSQIQSSRFPSPSSNQYNRVPQQSPFASQASAQASVSQQNFPVNAFGSQNSLVTRQPIQSAFSSPVPTSATQGSSGLNGITQATASSFISGAPTAATQFGSQNSFSGFGRRPTQPNNQFNNQVSSQSLSQTSQQTTAAPQSFSNMNRNQFGQQTSFQNQHPGQASNLNQGSSEDDSSNVPSQQYNGEIYEYTKPAQMLPPADEKEPSTGSGQFGNKQSSSTFVQSQHSQDATTSQSENQPGLQGRPQFGSQPSRPQFGQQSQFSAQNTLSSTRPQFGSQSTTPFGNAQPTQPSFAQHFEAQKTQHSSQFDVQESSDEGQNNRPQFGQRPFGSVQSTQSSQFNQASNKFDQSRPRPSCCKNLPSAPQSTQGSTQGLSGHNQGQFGGQDSGDSSQGFKQNQSSSQSFAGKGEVFGGPRKPPSFDEQTGYHY